jgi:hypothetical protein
MNHYPRLTQRVCGHTIGPKLRKCLDNKAVQAFKQHDVDFMTFARLLHLSHADAKNFLFDYEKGQIDYVGPEQPPDYTSRRY